MDKSVAIISYSFRFPGSDKLNFWQDLVANKNFITHVQAERWPQEIFLHPDKKHPGTSYTFTAGSLGDISGFDAGFFGISPREASIMDPQQKILLEMTWEAFENAGIVPASLRGSNTGVYIGISSVDGAYRLADDLAALDTASATGNLPSIAANRISYVYDLRGPSLAVDTACSSALVAFHQACQAIKTGEVSQALAGGINLHLHPYGFIAFSKATMLSKTGRCHVFDASADGYVRSEGGGVFFLKDYDKALADGDPILAVVAGNMVNTDGHKSGLTIPSATIQAELLTQVYKEAQIDPSDIDYLEAHGTGTPVGDPIETYAIGLSLGQKRKSPLAIGSIKSNVGHLESASGVAGLVKALGCIEHRLVPATIGVQEINPNILCEEWNIDILTKNQPLKEHGQLIIGVNSFGFGGANAHVVLKSPEKIQRNTKRSVSRLQCNPLPLLISSKDNVGLNQAAEDLARFIGGLEKSKFYDAAYSSFYHRELHKLGAVVFANSKEEALKQLKNFTEQKNGVATGVKLVNPHGPVFVYSGNGCQWLQMGKLLLEQSQVFKRAIVEVDNCFSKYASYSLIDELKGLTGNDRYTKTEFAQPALFAVQVGITEMLREYGVQPLATVGHSVGEVAAAWASGALSLPQAVKVIYFRSLYQGKTHGSGQMTAVGVGEKEIDAILQTLESKNLSLAGINSFRGVTIAGKVDELTHLEAELLANNIFYKRLDLEYAFHSEAMQPIRLGLVADLGLLKPETSAIPFYSTVTGSKLTGKELDGEYWWHNVRETVQFQKALQQVIADGFNTFVEIGSHPVLRVYLQDSLKEQHAEGMVISTMSRQHDDLDQFLKSVGMLLIAGVNVDKRKFFPIEGKFINLPNYPWQRQSYIHPVTSESYGLLTRAKVHPLLGYPLIQQPTAWENQLDTQLQPYLSDHNVGGAVVFPGAGFVEMALAAAYQLKPDEWVEIEDLEIQLPLLLNDEQSKVVRFEVKSPSGQFTIKSRNLVSHDDWSKHVVGRIVPQGGQFRFALDVPELPNRKPDFNLISHSQLTEWTGLHYGQAFKTISHGWSDDNSALGLFTVPDNVQNEIPDYFLFPGFLDCAFQLIFQVLKNEVFNYEGVAFVPIKLGRIYLRTDKPEPYMARAVLKKRSPHSINTQFVIFDKQGGVIAVLNDVRFRAVKLHSKNKQHLDFIRYFLSPAPLSLAWSSIYSLQLQGTLSQELRRAFNEPNNRRYGSEVEPLLDSLCAQFIFEALTKFADSKGKIAKATLRNSERKNPEIAKLWQNIIKFAKDNHLIKEKDEKSWLLNHEVVEHDLSAMAFWNALIREYPDYLSLLTLVGRFGLHLEDCLRGNTLAENIGIRPDVYAKVSHQVLENNSRKLIGDACKEQLKQVIRSLKPGDRLSILEIGAYKPLFVNSLINEIDFKIADYCFGSFDDEAINHAEGLVEQFPLFKTIKFPLKEKRDVIDGRPFQANFAVIALNSAKIVDLKNMFIELPKLLAPGSPVLVVGQQPGLWIDEVFGIHPAWWLEDESSNFISPQLTAEQVSEQLSVIGFEDLQILTSADSEAIEAYVITAIAGLKAVDVENEIQSHYLIIKSNNEFESELANVIERELKRKNHRVTVSEYGHQRYPEDAVHHLINKASSDHIILLAGIGEESSNFQNIRCHLTAEIAQHFELSGTKAHIHIVTSGVGSLFANEQHYREDSVCNTSGNSMANDAAIWGFGRTLINEASSYHVQLIDINGQMTVPAVLQSLIEALTSNQSEQEIVLDKNGRRFVPRLRQILAPNKQEISVGNENLTLGFKLPGQLRNLNWEPVPEKLLGENELKIAVKATGLNFRDVMYALGLLSDEAVENGFVGSSLGLEFAGDVIAVGSQVIDYKLGDRIVGFGPACFSTQLITKVDTVAKIPNQIDYAAAATIPSTFFTAYYALVHQAQLQTNEKILIHGAAGGVGIAAIQIAQWLGAEIYATAGSEEKRDFLRLMGIEHLYDSRSLSFAEEILAHTDGHGIDVVLNSLAGEAINRNFQVLKPFGRFLELGKRDFYENTHIGLRPFRNNISYFGIDADQLMVERPALTRKLFAEMFKLFEGGVLTPLPYTKFEANQVTEAFRYMQQAKQIGKIVVTYDNPILTKPQFVEIPLPALQLSPNATYAVTGGLGGFGLKTAQWLVAKGARYLVLLSRRGSKSEEAIEFLSEFSSMGVEVYAQPCDITDMAALTNAFTKIKKSMPPLKGIIHAATVIEDALVANLTGEKIDKVMAPKIQGAWNLHELTQTDLLDFFVLYSSATTLFGNPGQSVYVAANHWLEALTAHRKANGLPTTCVAWGAIEDVGYLARHEKVKDALQSRMGGSMLNSETALNVLEKLIVNNRATVGVMELDWPSLARFLPSAKTDKFSELAINFADTEHSGDMAADVQRLMEELSDDELKSVFVDMLKQELGQILLMPVDNIDADQSVYDMGLDSLMGVELMVAIEARFGVQVPVMALSDAATINKLVDKLIAQLKGGDSAEQSLHAATQDQVSDLARKHATQATHEQIAEFTEVLNEDNIKNRIVH